MKKILFFTVAVMAIGFTSCKKDWTCKCTDAAGDTWEYQIKDSRKPEASLACTAYENLADETCTLN